MDCHFQLCTRIRNNNRRHDYDILFPPSVRNFPHRLSYHVLVHLAESAMCRCRVEFHVVEVAAIICFEKFRLFLVYVWAFQCLLQIYHNSRLYLQCEHFTSEHLPRNSMQRYSCIEKTCQIQYVSNLSSHYRFDSAFTVSE